MCIVYNAYNMNEAGEFPTRDAAIEWITKCANDWNYGIYRMWTLDGYDYYDVGPRTFCIISQ